MRKFEETLQISVRNLQSFGRLYFTPKQLFYEFCRVERLPFGIEPKTAALLFGASIIPASFSRKNKLNILLASGLILGGLALLRKTPHTLPTPVWWNEFKFELEKYLQHHEIEGLLQIEEKVEFANNFPADLTLYGLPKILICETDEIAQMLRANQFHLQTPCAVLSLAEAQPITKVFTKMLERAEKPQVYFLHNASAKSFSLIADLRQTLKLKDEIPLRVLGLRPVHAKRLHLFDQKTQNKQIESFADFSGLDEREKRWLKDGFEAEIAAISPIRLMRVLRRLILGLEIPPNEWQIQLPNKNLGFM